MFPIGDDNPTRTLPIATYVLIGMNIVVWSVVQGFGAEAPMAQSLCQYALIPGDLLNTVPSGTQLAVGAQWVCEIDSSSRPSSLVSSMFMHGGWLHIGGNMLFLWVFGDNVEDAMGPMRFFVFYLLCGLAAAAAQIAADPSSIVPMVGASGAIGGVMGAYALLYPRAKVKVLIVLIVYVTVISVPAFVMLGYWFIVQVVSGMASVGNTGGGVAFWAHIGGFVAGLALVFFFKQAQPEPRDR